MQLHAKEAGAYLCEDIHPTADEVASFFKPIFSEDADQKALEEVIIYNWHKFLNKIESEYNWYGLAHFLCSPKKFRGAYSRKAVHTSVGPKAFLHGPNFMKLDV